MAKLGFWADMTGVALNEGEGSWVHALSLGKFDHAMFGEIDINMERVQRFAANVKARARGIDPSINYDHINMGEAAGWVKDAEARPDGLWLLVDWTEPAREKIAKRLYRYFSSEFDDEWEDPKTHVKFQDVLFGGALTNRPFLKDLVPVNLSELTGDHAGSPERKEGEGEGMDPKQLRTLLGLSETASDADVEAKIKTLSESKNTPPPADAPSGNTPPPGDQKAPESKSADVLLAELVDATNNPAVTALKEMITNQQKDLSEYKKKLAEERVAKKLSELETLAKKHNVALPAATLEQMRVVLSDSPQVLGDQVYDLYSKTIELGLVELGERGYGRRITAGDPQDRLAELVQDRMTKFKEDYSTAMESVVRDYPELYGQHRQNSYVTVEA
jgi:hypothetical protein